MNKVNKTKKRKGIKVLPALQDKNLEKYLEEKRQKFDLNLDRLKREEVNSFLKSLKW